MKHLKTLALAAATAGALMALIGVGTASATTLCSTTIETCPSAQKVTANLKYTLASGTKAIEKETGAEGGTLDECSGSEVEGSITNSGSSTATVTGSFSKLSWSGCTFPTTTTELGKFEDHKIAGTSNGTMTAATATKVTVNTVFFGTCVYTVRAGFSFGDLTEGNPAILHINAVTNKQEGSNFACPETSVWTATFTLTTPATTVSVSAG